MTSATFLDNTSLQLPFTPTECLLVEDLEHILADVVITTEVSTYDGPE